MQVTAPVDHVLDHCLPLSLSISSCSNLFQRILVMGELRQYVGQERQAPCRYRPPFPFLGEQSDQNHSLAERNDLHPTAVGCSKTGPTSEPFFRSLFNSI